MKGPRFTLADADRAHEEWGANCGPGALAAIVGMTLDEVRPHLVGFDAKRYTNPTMMFDALRSIGVRWREHHIGGTTQVLGLPFYGLARIQWEGPWTEPRANPKWRYRQTHWVAAARRNGEVGIFDINCMNNGAGWVSLKDWSEVIAPHLISQYPRANGKWHITHAIEVDQAINSRAGGNMKTIEDCMRDAFAALSRGDVAERDRQCALAMNLIKLEERAPRDEAA